MLLGAVGLVAIGANGALAELLGRQFGPAFVAGDLPGVTYTAQRCAEYLEYFPDAGSCAQAAALAVLSLDSFLVADGDGTSEWLSAAIVAAAMAVVYGVSLYRAVLPRVRTGVATLPLVQLGIDVGSPPL